jgi:hypothetical protein
MSKTITPLDRPGVRAAGSASASSVGRRLRLVPPHFPACALQSRQPAIWRLVAGALATLFLVAVAALVLAALQEITQQLIDLGARRPVPSSDD